MLMKAWLLLASCIVACGGSEVNPLLGEGGGIGQDTGTGGDGTTIVDTGTGDSSTTDTGMGMDAPMDTGTMVSPIGCSDGTREAFTNMNTHVNIAGCSGGWSVAGVTTQNSMTPQCNRNSGNSSGNTSGNGCSVEDLCASGWHVCTSSAEVQSHSGNGMCDTLSMLSSVNVWITRQSADGPGNCIANGHNNILGCQLGQVGGLAPGMNCAPLDVEVYYGTCQALPPWQCGSQNTPLVEADIVTKGGSDHGGVICCRN